MSVSLTSQGTDYLDYRADTTYTVVGLDFMDSVVWTNNTFFARVTYELFNDGYIFLEYSYSDVTGDIQKYTAAFLHGRRNTLTIGMNWGFEYFFTSNKLKIN